MTLFTSLIDRLVGVSVIIGDRKVESVVDVTGGNTVWNVKAGVLNISTDLDYYKLIVIKTV